MMKCKVTKKDVRARYGKRIIAIGYCAAQSLLRVADPFGYSAGVYGWACDYYDVDGICISTGYSPIGAHTEYAIVSHYEVVARAVWDNQDVPYESKRKMVGSLLSEFIAEAYRSIEQEAAE